MEHSLRIVYMGTPDFAVEPLHQLLKNGMQVVGVVTVPDKPAGRGQKLQQSPIKQFAEQNAIPVLQPVKLRDEVFLEKLREFNADLFVVVAFRMLPEVVWNMPPKGTINLHASLLPQYRGAAPINWAIINGEKVTGVTTFFISHDIDTGDILFQNKVTIEENETAGDIHDKLMHAGAKLLVTTVEQIAKGTIHPVSQVVVPDMKLAPKLFKDNCRINWSADSVDVNNFIRGLSPYPTAWSEMVVSTGNINVKIYKSALVFKYQDNHNLKPGAVLSDGKNFIHVACKNGFISIEELQLAGKKKLTTPEFLVGFRHINNTIFK